MKQNYIKERDYQYGRGFIIQSIVRNTRFNLEEIKKLKEIEGHMSGNVNNPISNHAWGIAIDINASDCPQKASSKVTNVGIKNISLKGNTCYDWNQLRTPSQNSYGALIQFGCIF